MSLCGGMVALPLRAASFSYFSCVVSFCGLSLFVSSGSLKYYTLGVVFAMVTVGGPAELMFPLCCPCFPPLPFPQRAGTGACGVM